MAPLSNQRHERFAQALAYGKTATEAYVATEAYGPGGLQSQRWQASR